VSLDALFMPVPMPQDWSIGPVLPEGAPEPPWPPVVQLRVGLEGDEAVRYYTGSREPRVLIVRLAQGERPEELVAVLTPGHIEAIGRFWLSHGVP
jgi:hypothetical protein